MNGPAQSREDMLAGLAAPEHSPEVESTAENPPSLGLPLAQFFVQTVMADLGVEIAFADDRLRILDHTPGLSAYAPQAQESLVGQSLVEPFPELIGCEEELVGVARGRLPRYDLPKVNRPLLGSDGLRYFSLIALPVPQLLDCLVLLVQDTTAESRLEQQVMQQLNELRLLRSQLEAANQELIRLDQEKSAFLQMAAHDLSSPLTVIRGYVDMIVDNEGGLSKEILAHYLGTIQSRVLAMTSLIRNLLDVEKIESGEVVFQREPVDLAYLMTEVAQDFELLARQNGLELQWQIPAALPHPLADRERLVQVLNNLVSNALKFTPAGGRVHVEAFEGDGGVSVEVVDTGPGISAEDQSRLFQRFFRSAQVREQRIPGTGLGLSIVQAIVEQMGGRVYVQSQLGQGSTFGFTLPVEEG